MYPKPPVTRTGKSGWLGHQTTRLKSLAVLGAFTLGFAGAAFAAAAPASADPAFQFTEVGSDTIQSMMDLFAGQTSGGIIGSYDAVNPVSQVADEIITPGVAQAGGAQQNCSFTRPNGSGQGFKALVYSQTGGSTTLGQLAVPPQAGCLTLSRSSGAPGSVAASGPGSLDTSGNLVYIPFALDAVTDATGPTTAMSETIQCVSTTTGCTNVVNGIGTITFTTTPTHITNASMFTLADLQTLYGSCTNVVVNGVTYNPNTAGAGQQQINLYAPQNGSGTLAFWESKMGVTAVQSCWHQTIVAGPGVGISVEEHDGSALASDPNGIAPYSIAKWLAFSNGVATPDLRHGAVLEPIGGIQPVSSGNLNTNFPIVREVYNVVPWAEVTSGQTGFNPVLAGLFAGTSSALCQSTFTIEQEGFGPLPSPSTPDSCGSTANSLRVQETNNGPG
jgi:hypothetical protein